MKISGFFILTFLLLGLVACKKQPYKDYEGNWSGTYSGEDTGKWSVTINDEGKVNGTATSDSVQAFPFELTGNVSEKGKFTSEVNVFFGMIDFNGQLSGNKASGNWVNAEAQIEGTWEGKKN